MDPRFLANHYGLLGDNKIHPVLNPNRPLLPCPEFPTGSTFFERNIAYPLSRNYFSPEERLQYLPPLLIAYWNWDLYPSRTKKQLAKKLLCLTCNQIVTYSLSGLGLDHHVRMFKNASTIRNCYTACLEFLDGTQRDTSVNIHRGTAQLFADIYDVRRGITHLKYASSVDCKDMMLTQLAWAVEALAMVSPNTPQEFLARAINLWIQVAE